MNRSRYYNYIDEKMVALVTRINNRGQVNLLELNIHSENFFSDFLNVFYDYNLQNANAISQNIAAIDLVDNKHKVIIQVSSNATKSKVEGTLKKELIKQYSDYQFKFMALVNDVGTLKEKSFNNPHSITFDPIKDILDIKTLMKELVDAPIDKLKDLYVLVQKELGLEVDVRKLDFALTKIINVLAEEGFTVDTDDSETIPFEIDNKIEFNNLVSSRYIIEDYTIYHERLNDKYEVFDQEGVCKSYPILQLIRKHYFKLSKTIQDEDEVFFSIIDELIQLIQQSTEYDDEMLHEDLEVYVGIVVVDAFIRCKIFKNPKGYCYVTTR